MSERSNFFDVNSEEESINTISGERRYRAALDNIIDAVVFLDDQFNIVDGNAATASLVGADVEGRSATELIHPSDLALAASAFEDLVSRPGSTRNIRIRVRLGGDWRWVLACASSQLTDPTVGAIVVSFRDLTPEVSLRRSDAMFRSLVSSVPIGIVAGSERWSAGFVNQAFADLVGRSVASIRRSGWIDALDPVTRAELEEVDTTVGTGVRIIEWTTPDASIQLDVKIPGGGSYVVAATDISGIVKELQAERSSAAMWAHAATHDQVTGLANRALGMDRLTMAIASARRVNRSVSVTFVDLDGFKQINDRFGHHVGDSVLRVVAERLEAATRAEDTVARWGGDEFVVIAQVDDDLRTAEALGARLIAQVNAPIEVVGGPPLQIACSMGMAVSCPRRAQPSSLLRSADAAMYEAKRRRTGVEIVQDDNR